MRSSLKVVGVATAALALWLVPQHDKANEQPAAESSSPPAFASEAEAPASGPSASAPSRTKPPAVKPRPPVVPLLRAAAGGDGDSWRDTSGREYRLGLVNTPESSECFGGTATAKRKTMTAAGFRARAYATDVYGRSVSVVTTAAGVNLNVYLARHGYANDKYLAQFRAENPSLAAQLDVAFAAAKREHAGLWAACTGPQGFAGPAPAKTAAPVTGQGCHPDYVTCIPVKGDGSGSGQANDLDCPDIGRQVTLRQAGVDPYRLDADGDGIGCDSYG